MEQKLRSDQAQAHRNTTNRIPPAMMELSLAKLTSTGSRLFRSLLSLVVRLSRLRVAPTLRSWSALLWRPIILTFARYRDQSRIRWHTNDAPMLASAPNPGESSNAEPDKEHSGTLATPPTIDWKDTLLKLQKLTSNCQVKPVEVLPATPEGASQRYKPRTVK